MIGETDQLFNEYSTGNTEISIANCIKMHTKYAYIYIQKERYRIISFSWKKKIDKEIKEKDQIKIKLYLFPLFALLRHLVSEERVAWDPRLLSIASCFTDYW